jgi:methionyl-tRNA formyltransferase
MSFRILFMGTPDFAVPILKSVHETKHKVLEVYTQPPKKKNRGQKIKNSPVHNVADKFNIPVRTPIEIGLEEINHIKEIKPDVVVVAAYGKILPSNLLNLDKVQFINVHASLLPKWRGAAPIQRSIMSLDNETGVSIMKIVPKLDSGPLITKSKIKITNQINSLELSNKMSKLGSKLILETLDLIEKNNIKYTEQDESKATYAKKIEKKELKINWKEPAKKVIAKINAFSPYPGCWFEHIGSRIKVLKAKEIFNIKSEPGLVIDNDLTVACLNNAIQILEIQKEGKHKMTSEEFTRGNSIKIGQKLN